jgi:transketolase
MNVAMKPPEISAATKSVRAQFAETMLEVGMDDPRLVVMVGDISHFVLQPFAEACPGRFYNIGICEPASVSIAAGLSKVGFHPVFHTIAPFIVERAFEQVKLDFCYHKLGGNLITVGGAFDYANLGCTHHCYNDFALLKTLPNVQICCPGSAIEFDSLFRQSYRNDALTYHRLAGHPHGRAFTPKEITLGKAVHVTAGSNLTIVAVGAQLRSALDALVPLRQNGWDAEILYVHTVRPLDVAAIRESAKKTGHVAVIEEHVESGSVGDETLKAVAKLPNIRFLSLAIPDTFVTDYGHYADHCRRLDLSAEGLVKRLGANFGALSAS